MKPVKKTSQTMLFESNKDFFIGDAVIQQLFRQAT